MRLESRWFRTSTNWVNNSLVIIQNAPETVRAQEMSTLKMVAVCPVSGI